MNENSSSRPEAAMVLMLLQATFWLGAGLSALPFALAGEVYMVALGGASVALAVATVVLALAVVGRRGRRWTIALELVCVIGSAIQLVAPVGTNRGPVSLLVNLVLPAAVIVLLAGGGMRRHPE